MGKVAAAILLAVIGAVIVASAALMNMFFGLVGVGFLVAFLLPMVALIAWLSGGFSGGDGGSNTGSRRRQSKGARSRDR